MWIIINKYYHNSLAMSFTLISEISSFKRKPDSL